MKRFAVFAIVGPLIAAATLFLILLPVAGVLEGEPVVISTPVLPAYSYTVLAALVVALFDWVASLIELPFRPIGAAIAGWVLAFILLRGYLALPTAMVSWNAATKNGLMSGSSRKLPIGWRASAVMPALAASWMNFIQRSVVICSLNVASKPACRHSARKSSPRRLFRPSSSPKIIRMKLPTCWI